MKILRNIFFAAVFLLVVFICVFVISSRDGEVAEIYCDGEMVERINLQRVEKSYTLDVGEGNTVIVEQGKISMHDADCPDKLCIKQGSNYPIVCLPNKIIIKVK